MSQIKISPLKDTPVFEPIKVGKNTFTHKIVYAPTTRIRALEDHTPSDLNLEYYDQRSKYPGTLLITEATFVSPEATGYPNAPGIWTDKHAKAWKAITDRVHKNGSFMSCQFWFLGRVADTKLLVKEGQDLVGPSAIYPDEKKEKEAIETGKPLRELREDEIERLINEVYPNAARKAIAAGFDYIELHGAHGYLLDQFLHPASNQRTDKFGGSIEKRALFVLRLVDRLIEEVGAEKLAIRISPWASVQGIKADNDSVHSITTFSYLLHELQKRANEGKQLAYVSIVEPRVNGVFDVKQLDLGGKTNEFVYQIWKGIIVRSGNYAYDVPHFNTLKLNLEDGRTLAGFARYFTSNPDLVHRLKEGLDLHPYQRELFYKFHNWGYTTYPNYGEEMTAKKEEEERRVPREIKV